MAGLARELGESGSDVVSVLQKIYSLDYAGKHVHNGAHAGCRCNTPLVPTWIVYDKGSFQCE
jgi:hypothetical protein